MKLPAGRPTKKNSRVIEVEKRPATAAMLGIGSPPKKLKKPRRGSGYTFYAKEQNQIKLEDGVNAKLSGKEPT
jgi:hypothetical protein